MTRVWPSNIVVSTAAIQPGADPAFMLGALTKQDTLYSISSISRDNVSSGDHSGMLKMAGSASIRLSAPRGTANYMSLELANKGIASKSCDLYSARVCIWFLLAGELPAPCDVHQVLSLSDEKVFDEIDIDDSICISVFRLLSIDSKALLTTLLCRDQPGKRGDASSNLTRFSDSPLASVSITDHNLLSLFDEQACALLHSKGVTVAERYGAPRSSSHLGISTIWNQSTAHQTSYVPQSPWKAQDSAPPPKPNPTQPWQLPQGTFGQIYDINTSSAEDGALEATPHTAGKPPGNPRRFPRFTEEDESHADHPPQFHGGDAARHETALSLRDRVIRRLEEWGLAPTLSALKITDRADYVQALTAEALVAELGATGQFKEYLLRKGASIFSSMKSNPASNTASLSTVLGANFRGGRFTTTDRVEALAMIQILSNNNLLLKSFTSKIFSDEWQPDDKS